MLCGVSTLSIANLASDPKDRMTCGSFVIRPANVKGGIVIANSSCRAQGVYTWQFLCSRIWRQCSPVNVCMVDFPSTSGNYVDLACVFVLDLIRRSVHFMGSTSTPPLYYSPPKP